MRRQSLQRVKTPERAILEAATAVFVVYYRHIPKDGKKVVKAPEITVFFDFHQKICYNIHVR